MNFRRYKQIVFHYLSAVTGIFLIVPANGFSAPSGLNGTEFPTQQVPLNQSLPNLPAPDHQEDMNETFPPPPVKKTAPNVPSSGPKITPELKHLLNISALKAEFMLIALTCNKHKEYDSFIAKFRPLLQQGYQSLKVDFYKLYGEKGDVRLDQYITDLADAASLKAAREGGNFCKTHVGMFHEAEYFQTPEDLSAYAEGKNLAVPLPKSPTGRRDASPVTLSETTSFARFAHPLFTQQKPPLNKPKPKTSNFVPVEKNRKLPPLEEPAATKTRQEEKTKNPAITSSPPPLFQQKEENRKPLPAPQPYPEISANH